MKSNRLFDEKDLLAKELEAKYVGLKINIDQYTAEQPCCGISFFKSRKITAFYDPTLYNEQAVNTLFRELQNAFPANRINLSRGPTFMFHARSIAKTYTEVFTIKKN